MSNREKARLVPKLRFPEFRGVEGWSRKRLKDACEVNPSSSTLPEMFVYIDLESVEAGKLTARKVIARDDAPSRAQRLLHPDDVIFQIVRPYQRNNFHFKASDSLEYVASTGYAQLRAKDSADFLYQAVHVDGFVDRVIAKCTGSSYPAINSSDLAEVPLVLPKPDEQQKIADCLSSLGELIAAQARKVDTLKTHKKGLMQQLFPREAKNQPRLRFPEFRDAAIWNEVAAGQLFSNRVERGNSRLPIYSVTINDGMVPRSSLDRRIDDIAECGANKTVSKGDIAYNMMRMWQGALGVAPVDCMVSPAYIVLKPKAANTVFFSYVLKQPQMLRVLTAYSRGLTEDRLRLYYDDFAKVPLLCPSVVEQNRIADFLSSLDSLITVQTQALETLKTHKKGLMQQLFPLAEAVEG